MPATTQVNKIPYPLLSDPPNAPDQLQKLAAQIDPRVPFSAADAAARDALVAGALVAGMKCFLTSVKQWSYYDGAAWQVLPPPPFPVVASGSLSITPTGIGAATIQAITFPVGRFTAAPMVMTAHNATSNTDRMTSPSSITTTGFNFMLVSQGGGAVPVSWLAVQTV